MTRSPLLAGGTTPHDDDAEASVLGGIMFRNEALGLLPTLEVEDFYNPKHQAVLQAMRALEGRMMPLDTLTVASELERMGRYQAVGGEAFLGSLGARCPSLANVEHYARILEGHRMSRDVARACADVMGDIAAGELAGSEAIRVAVSHLMGIAARLPDAGRTVGDLMLAELDAIDRDMAALGRGEAISVGVSTGIQSLDDETGGYPIGSVSVDLGATGHGKSTLLFTGARAGAAQGDLAIVYSFEDPSKFWGQRGLAQETGVPTEAIARRKHLAGSMRRLAAARMSAKNRTEIVVPAGNMTVDDVIRDAQARRLKDRALRSGKKRRCSIWIDYIQAMRFAVERNGNRVQAIEVTMNKLAWLAQGCGSPDPADECAVIAASQTNKSVVDEKRAPKMDDPADCFGITKVCKFMLGINRPSKYDAEANPMVGRLDVLKRNQGDDEVYADVVMNLATHTITAANAPREPDAQTQIGAV